MDVDGDMVALALEASAAIGSWSWSSVGEGVERVVPSGVVGGGGDGGIIQGLSGLAGWCLDWPGTVVVRRAETSM